MISGLPRNLTARMSDASQASFLCSHDIHYMAQLTSNTDGRVNKLVMFFAKASLPSRQDTAGGQTRRPRSPLRFDTGALPASAVNKITIGGQMTCSQPALYRETYITLKNFVPGRQKTCHTLLPRPQNLCTPIQGYCLPAGMRRVTLTYSTAGPLGVIAQRKLDLLLMTILYSGINL